MVYYLFRINAIYAVRESAKIAATKFSQCSCPLSFCIRRHDMSPAFALPPTLPRLTVSVKRMRCRVTAVSRLDVSQMALPVSVRDAIRRVYTEGNAAVHRGGCAHHLGRNATESMAAAREDVARLIEAAEPDEIVFTGSAAAAYNIVARGLMATLRKGSEILLSTMEDDHCVVPWQLVAERTGARLRFVRADMSRGGEYDFGSLVESLNSRTQFVVLQHVSSVFGCVNPVEDVIQVVRGAGISILVDATHSLGRLPVSVARLQCDYLIADGEHMHATQGSGFLYGRRKLLQTLDPAAGGQDTMEDVSLDRPAREWSPVWAPIPHRFEAGMAPLACAAALSAAARHICAMDMSEVGARNERFGKMLFERLRACGGVTVYGTNEEPRVAMATFNVDGLDARSVADALARRGVIVEAGCHGAHLVHTEELKVAQSLRVRFDVQQHGEEVILMFIDALEVVVKAGGVAAIV